MKKQIAVGDEFNVEFLRNSGKRPVCRINGMVGFIDNTYTSFIAPGSSWMVRVSSVSERFVQVIPIVESCTAKENHDKLKKAIKGISEKTSVLPLSSKDKKTFSHRFYL